MTDIWDLRERTITEKLLSTSSRGQILLKAPKQVGNELNESTMISDDQCPFSVVCIGISATRFYMELLRDFDVRQMTQPPVEACLFREQRFKKQALQELE